MKNNKKRNNNLPILLLLLFVVGYMAWLFSNQSVNANVSTVDDTWHDKQSYIITRNNY